MPQHGLDSAANLAAIFGPEPFTSLAETTGLDAEQMKHGITIPGLARRNAGLDYFVVEMQ